MRIIIYFYNTNFHELIKNLSTCGWINYVGRPVRPTRYQPGATPWESVMCDCRPERAKALPKHHSFAFSGRIYPFPTTQGVALGYELVALSGRFNRTSEFLVNERIIKNYPSQATGILHAPEWKNRK